MTRFHVNVTVSNLAKSVGFYAELFGLPPTIEKDDYAKWLLDDPQVNFSLSTHGARYGIDHIGLQVDDQQSLQILRQRLEQADTPIFEQADVNCCYVHSSKAWVRDPDGVAWETFLSHGDSTEYGDGSRETAVTIATAPTIGKEQAGCCGQNQLKQKHKKTA